MGHFEEIHEEVGVAAAKPRFGLREYSSENGPLVHRTVIGTEEKHFNLRNNTFYSVNTPSELASIEEAMAMMEGAS